LSVKNALLGWVGAVYLRLLRASWRLDEQPGRFVTRRREVAPTGCIWLMWHSRILIGAATQADQDMRVMVSMHGDGELIARACSHVGFKPLRGSSSRGGHEVLSETVNELIAGRDVAITPDGPRGPRMSVQPGCVLAAMRADVPIVPVGFSAKRHRRLRSWDRFMVPGFFTRVVVRFGEPMAVPPDLDADEVRVFCGHVRLALLEVSRLADEAAGVGVETPDADPL